MFKGKIAMYQKTGETFIKKTIKNRSDNDHKHFMFFLFTKQKVRYLEKN